MLTTGPTPASKAYQTVSAHAARRVLDERLSPAPAHAMQTHSVDGRSNHQLQRQGVCVPGSATSGQLLPQCARTQPASHPKPRAGQHGRREGSRLGLSGKGLTARLPVVCGDVLKPGPKLGRQCVRAHRQHPHGQARQVVVADKVCTIEHRYLGCNSRLRLVLVAVVRGT